MAYTTTQLITGAYYASGIVSREFETVGGNQISESLIWLNEIIGKKVVEPNLIPYEGQTTFTGVVGQEAYSISNLIHIDTLTFIKDSVRYSVTFIPRNQYQGSTRVNTIDSLPYEYYYERGFGGATVYLYFFPNDTYTFTINGIFRLSNVTLNQDLSLTLDTFYTSFLKWELTKKICDEYAMPVPQNVLRELDEYRALIKKQSRPLDLHLRKNSTLQSPNRLGWAWVNLGEGYLPD